MADQKLTDRDELAELPADGDLVHVVDVSDTTDSAEGTSKKWKILTWLKTLFIKRIEGDGSRNVLRAIAIEITPGDTPGTNVNVTLRSVAYGTWNAPAIENAVNLAKNGVSGSWHMSASGKDIWLDVTPDILTFLGLTITTGKWNTAEAVPYYIQPHATDETLRLYIARVGSATLLDWTTILDAGDAIYILILFLTST